MDYIFILLSLLTLYMPILSSSIPFLLHLSQHKQRIRRFFTDFVWGAFGISCSFTFKEQDFKFRFRRAHIAASTEETTKTRKQCRFPVLDLAQGAVFCTLTDTAHITSCERWPSCVTSACLAGLNLRHVCHVWPSPQVALVRGP